MSENKSSNPGTPGTGSPGADSSGSIPGSHSPAVPPASSQKSSDIPAAAQPGRTASAAERASTDAPESASTVEPVDTAKAQRDDAAEARVLAARATSAQETAARETTSASGSAANKTLDPNASLAAKVETATDAEASLAAEVKNATEAQAAETAEAKTSGATESVAPPPASSLPPEFAGAPDFGTFRPPPPPDAAEAKAPPAYLRQSDSAWSVFGRVMKARARQIFDRAGQRITQRTLRIGVSARIFHPEPGAKGLRGKTLQYLEESIAHWVMSRDVLVFMIPTVGHQGMLHPSNIRLRDYAKHLDGLLLQGGADVSPQSYTEAATRHEWPGDRVRDMYELELLHEFIESGKPVLGVCRGCQLINVAFGGTLYQDIATDVPTAGVHVNDQYDQHRHPIRFPDGSTLVNMFPGHREALVNSIHHQAVKTIGRDLNIEAVSAHDGIIEAVRYRRAPFVMGVQWHPEFHRAGGDELLDCTPLLDTFLRVARETRF
ncbi:gamma-glutamyl-gamma-aminobutyrate hydrolase family protein [Caballeronia mineralivorans]|jgi:gamma-glutamyl-gamma-aminobutyrate hydrolase PuuD|uniref:gamma-glutamyl-gamma-aminobutyrate hydrolase family protein n=1 Tax=Caballeronia mineralivorans TaxID=2010198 RepID=UPI0023F06053|nr:gamma-glutamyl-gamma-aminobutyrate hydrolase family protein [Caballeronia mineralivorans]MDB5780942.1 peptidase [Caballeronia mineralivorans]